MHQTRLFGGKGQAGALFDWQGIEIHAQANHRAVLGAQFRHHTRAANTFTHLPAELTQLAGHQRRGALLMAAQLRMGMQITANLQQGGLIVHAWPPSSAKKRCNALTGCGGQRRTCSNHCGSL